MPVNAFPPKRGQGGRPGQEENLHGTCRPKDLILDAYDLMAAARETGGAYQTLLDPPPGKGPRQTA
ncbi:hypothetical protein QFZ75_001457 [Streptomyces sp. V3I8]|uniref:hypothetical protein n=1 Tax=Streptomyces sp. V3I8 TaxID=3042279 RepID=UPI002781AA4A|nr:hypothetical protein [Streptomyces sp. V3I8]MDQ1035041.1 hypothetical protein [Streptomyces sp. V3I8]